MNRIHSSPHSCPSWSVDELLQDHIRTRERIEKLGPLPLSPLLKSTLWVLRLYVVFMISVVVINIIKQAH